MTAPIRVLGKCSPARCGPASRTEQRRGPHLRLPPQQPNSPRASSTTPGPWPGRRSWSTTTAPGPHGDPSGICTASECSFPPAKHSRSQSNMRDWISDKEFWQPAPGPARERPDRCLGHQRHRRHFRSPIYPPGTKLFLRAGSLHPGAQPTLLHADGHRITALLTTSPRWHEACDARHRAGADARTGSRP